MSAQTEPVDVLAVMDSCTDELEKQPGCYYTDAAKLQEARAAIAELIEAGEEFASCDSLDTQKRFKAALARVGATK